MKATYFFIFIYLSGCATSFKEDNHFDSCVLQCSGFRDIVLEFDECAIMREQVRSYPECKVVEK